MGSDKFKYVPIASGNVQTGSDRFIEETKEECFSGKNYMGDIVAWHFLSHLLISLGKANKS
jgi:hypothetical protein